MRLAFVGQSTFFEACALQDGVTAWTTTFLEFRKDGDVERLLAGLRRFDPDAIVVFRPEVLPAGTLAGLACPKLGFLTEPLPRRDGEVAHDDLQRRLWELSLVDAANVDRVVTFDPHIARTADAVLPVWRSAPLPVADRYYAPVPLAPQHGPPRPLFVGRSTPHRERFLASAKHLYDVLHLAFGVDADGLAEAFATHDVGINVHNEPYPSFENRVCLHLAAGHLVLSEPLDPLHGLEPGIDFVEVRSSNDLEIVLWMMGRYPGLHERVRTRGRHKAEQYRASRVWPRLVGDLLRDVAARPDRRLPASTAVHAG